MKLLQEELNFLLDKYDVPCDAVLDKNQTVNINGAIVPLLAHRFERQFIELKNIVLGGTLQGVSVMRTARIVAQGMDLYEQLYRELDLCEYILGRKIYSIMAMENGCCLNVIASAEGEVVCTIEIAATLQPGESFKEKHEIISQRGIACDVVVDAQLKQNSIYVFGEQNEVFTDVDFELYGIAIADIATVRSAFALAKDGGAEKNLEVDSHLKQLVEMAKKTVLTGEKEVI